MANDCNFDMKVIGTKENIEKFYEWLSADYNYDEKNEGPVCYKYEGGRWEEGAVKIPVEHHIGYRIFDAYMDDLDIYNGNDNTYIGFIYGYCAWSTYSCMFEGTWTYITDNENEKGRKSISLPDATELLQLKVEMFSEEPGMGFSEHYYIDNGEIICEDCEDFSEWYDEENDIWERQTVNWDEDEESWKWEFI